MSKPAAGPTESLAGPADSCLAHPQPLPGMLRLEADDRTRALPHARGDLGLRFAARRRPPTLQTKQQRPPA
jgi:hypothetical protein